MNQFEPSAADVVRYDHVIRLTQYRHITGTASQQDIADFITAWKDANAVAPRAGIVYRELCRQAPEWSALAAKEIENPIDAVFLEYLIAEPEVDLDSVPALPAGAETRFDTVQDIHAVAFRFTKSLATAPSGALMFNLFEIDGPPGLEQGFLMGWPARGEFKINEAAVRSTMLHKHLLESASIKAFNRAEIVSAAAYAEGIGRFETAFPRVERAPGGAPGGPPPGAAGGRPPIRSHLGLFEIVALAPPGAPAAGPDMQAVEIDGYGPPEVLTARRVRRPDPGPGQIRIKVHACAINALDIKMRAGDVRHIYPSWFPDVVGYSVAGIVDAVGRGVTTRLLGEEVYGTNDPIQRHGYAEYLIGPERNFCPKPSSLDFPAAASAPSLLATAYGALFLRTNLQAGQSILIHGGAGSVGSLAVQLAKRAGAHVIATASAGNLELLRRIGADVVVDYRAQRFEDFADQVDVVLDTVGGQTRERSWPLIRPGGVLASLVPPPPDLDPARPADVAAFMVHGHPDIGAILPEMTRLIDAGELELPPVAEVFPLAQAARAHSVSEGGSQRGRIVLIPGE